MTDHIAHCIDKFRYSRKIKAEEKILDSYSADVSLKSDYLNYEPEVKTVHKIIPYQVYRLYLSDGTILECADIHLVFGKSPFGIEGWYPV